MHFAYRLSLRRALVGVNAPGSNQFHGEPVTLAATAEAELTRTAETAAGYDLRILNGHRLAATDLRRLLEGEVAQYHRDAAPDRVVLQGEPMMLPARLVQPLAMVVHELATTAAEHGALSVPVGRVVRCWSRESGPAGSVLRLHCSGLSVRWRIDDPASYQVTHHRAVTLTALPCAIVDADDPDGSIRHLWPPPQHPQQCVAADWQHEAARRTRSRSAAQGDPEMMDDALEPCRASGCPRCHAAVERLAE